LIIFLVQEIINTDAACGRCGKNRMITDNVTGEKFCEKCGCVLSGTMQDSGPEWRSFSKEGGGTDPARAGAPTSLAIHDKGLATIINPINRDSAGKPLTSVMKNNIERLRTWDSRSKVNASADRNLRQAFGELSRLKDKLAVSDAVIQKAASISLQKGIGKKSCQRAHNFSFNRIRTLRRM
jgi:transcription initiation factor TFIIB